MKMRKKHARRESPRKPPQLMMSYCRKCKQITQHVKVVENLSPATITEYYCCEICR